MDDGFEMNLTQRREGARTQRAVANDSFVMIFMVCSKCYLKQVLQILHVLSRFGGSGNNFSTGMPVA